MTIRVVSGRLILRVPNQASKYLPFLLLLVSLSLFTGHFVQATGQFYTKTWGGPGDDQANSVALDPSGNIYVTGYTTSFGAGDSDVLLLGYGPTGNLLFQETWGGNGTDVGNAIAVDSAGSLYVTGSTSSFRNGSSDVFLLKFNSQGALEWQRTWGSTNADQAYGLGLDGLGNIYVAGVYNITALPTGGDVFILKFNSTGSILWQTSWGGRFDEQANSLVVDKSGVVYVAGWTDSFDVKNNGQEKLEYCPLNPCFDDFLLAFNSTGDLQKQTIWRVSDDGAQGDTASGLALDSSGNLYVVGDTCSSNCTVFDLAVSKLNSTGSLLWEEKWHQNANPHYDFANAVSLDSAGNMYISGSGEGDVLLLKLDSNGQLVTAQEWGGSGEDSSEALTLDSSANPIVVGYVGAPGYKLQALIDPMITALANSTTPAAEVHALNIPPVTANAPSSQVAGKTTYAGGIDLFINYGSSFKVPAFPQFGILLLVGFITALSGKFRKKRLSNSSSAVGLMLDALQSTVASILLRHGKR